VFVVLAAVAVALSDDVQHPDEHLQTIELAGHVLGTTPRDALPWEFEARMRPWLQPAAYVALWRALGRDVAPSVIATVFRASSAVMALVANTILTLAIHATIGDPRARRVAVAALWLGFWGPYLAVRTSSEATAGAFVGMAIGVLVLEASARTRAPRTTMLFVVGFLLGVAFELRYQTGIMTAGVLAWMLGPGRAGRLGEDARRWLAVAGGAALALALGTCIDRLGYGVWTCAPYNYFRENLVKGAAAEFGTAPPFAFLWTAHAAPTAVVTLALFAAVAIGWVRGRRHVATWAAAPFFVVHAMIAHKETRFLFPLLGLSAIHVGLALDGGGLEPKARTNLLERLLRTAVGRLASVAVVATNLAALACAPFVLRYPMFDCERFLARDADVSRAVLVDDPYDYGGDLFVYAWRPRPLRLEHARDAAALASALSEPGRLYVVAKEPFPDALRGVVGDARVAYHTPAWRARLGAAIGGARSDERWVVFAR
jgi:phosphatidylinositol glycan class B